MEEKLRNFILTYPIGSDERNFLRTLLGDVVSKKQRAETVVREAYQRNETLMNREKKVFDFARLESENKVLKSLLGYA